MSANPLDFLSEDDQRAYDAAVLALFQHQSPAKRVQAEARRAEFLYEARATLRDQG